MEWIYTTEEIRHAVGKMRALHASMANAARAFLPSPEAQAAIQRFAEEMRHAGAAVRQTVEAFHAGMPLPSFRLMPNPELAALLTLRRKRATNDERERAAKALVERACVRTYGPRESEALRRWTHEQARATRAILSEIALAETLPALEDIDEDLPIPEFVQRYLSRVRTRTREAIVEPYSDLATEGREMPTDPATLPEEPTEDDVPIIREEQRAAIVQATAALMEATTPRRREVIGLLQAGASNEDIESRLNLHQGAAADIRRRIRESGVGQAVFINIREFLP